MAVDIGSIIDGLAAIERGMTPPAGLTTPSVTAEPPTGPLASAAWLNLEEDTDYQEYRGFGVNSGPLVHTVSAYLLLSVADLKYRVRFRRQWEPVAAAAFESDMGKLSGPCIGAFLDKVGYVTVTYNGDEYLALKFPWRIIADRA